MIVKLPIPDWYIPFLYPCEYKNIYGGRGSGKSHSAATNAVCRMANLFSDPDNLKVGLPYYPAGPVRVLAGREFNTTIESSVKVVLESKIFDMGLNDQFQIQSEKIVHRFNRSQCIFKGLGRNINNVRSTEAIDIWWFEEAQFLTKDLMDIVIPTARRMRTCPLTGIEFYPEKWFVWNPKNRSDWVWVRFVMRPRHDDLSLHVNYHGNPYLPKVSLKEALICQKETPNQYQHDWEGRPDDGNIDAQILPYKIIERCVEAWPKRPEISAQMRTDAGLDIALGGDDYCAAAVRTGPIVHDIRIWPGVEDLNAIARDTCDYVGQVASRNSVDAEKIYYDGAHPMDGAFGSFEHDYGYEGVKFGVPPTGKDIYWDNKITNEAYFARRNIQMATAIRQRAIRTGRFLKTPDEVDPWDCLFINPEIEHLERVLGMLTQPVRKRNPTNDKWEIEKAGPNKELKSPDEFDALCLAFANDSYYGLRADSA